MAKVMNFFKKLTGGKSAKDTAMSAAKAAGLDPAVLMPKIFAHFCGGQTDGSGKPAMDFSKLLGFVKQTGIMDGGKINPGMLAGIFKQVTGGGGGSGEAPKAEADEASGGDAEGGDPSGTMNFDEFQKGMTKVAEKKYEDEGVKGDKALSKLEQQILSDNDLKDWGIE